MLAGNTREYIAGTAVARAVAAFAGNNVLRPVAAFGQLLTALQRGLIGVCATLASRGFQLAVIGSNIGDFLVVQHVHERRHGRVYASACLEVVNLLGEVRDRKSTRLNSSHVR